VAEDARATRVDWDRWSLAAGMLAAALFVVGFAILGENPGEDEAAQINAVYGVHGGRILVGETIILVSLVVVSVFFGGVASLLRTAGAAGLAAGSLVLGAAVVAAQTILQALDTTLAQAVADRGNDDITLAFHSLTWNIDVAVAMFLAGYIALVAIGLTQAGILPRWYAVLSAMVGVLVVLRGTNWAADGFWSPNGGYLYIGISGFLVWIVVTSALLFRRAGRDEGSIQA
jgi:hypothetical protein